jgi:predicted ArsR family transcriptional regulator
MNESFKALADPTRRQNHPSVAGKGYRTAGEIADYFNVSKPSISHHLNALKHAGTGAGRAAGPVHSLYAKHHGARRGAGLAPGD